MMFPKLHDHVATAPDAVITSDEMTCQRIHSK